MAAPYLMDLRELVRACLGDDAGSVTCRHFFSGASAHLNDTIIATLSPVGLAFKLSDTSCARELAGAAVPLRYFEKSPVKRNYALFEDVESLERDRVAALLREAIDHAQRTDTHSSATLGSEGPSVA